MTVTPLKIFLFTAGVSVAAGATAYVSGALDPYFGGGSPELASAAVGKADRVGISGDDKSSPVLQGAADSSGGKSAETQGSQIAALPDASTEVATAQPEPNMPAARGESAAPAKSSVIAPSFDVLRVEANGSILIAGSAAPGAKVEVLTGSRVLADAASGVEGDFAVVLERPLDPGEYEIVLRSTAPDNVVATSTETAVVSIPDNESGEVLALVEQPGQPSRLITVPEPEQPAAEVPEVNGGGAPEAKTSGAKESAAESDAQSSEMSAANPEQQPSPAGAEQNAAAPTIRVEAVEIEGRKIFVAGAADAGRLVRVYANETLLGETKASPEGRFLIEAERELPVGDYIIRADALEPDGGKVVARAAVPFEREPGENLAAVASPVAEPAAGAAKAGQAAGAAEATPATSTPDASAGAEAAPTKQAEISHNQSAAQADAPVETPAAASSEPAPSATNLASAEPGSSTAAPESSASTAPATDKASSAAVPETVAPKLQPVSSAVIIRRGDTLWQISRRVYGRGVRYATIYLANQEQIRNPDLIWPGQVFRVPEKTDAGEKADMKAIGEQAVTAQ